MALAAAAHALHTLALPTPTRTPDAVRAWADASAALEAAQAKSLSRAPTMAERADRRALWAEERGDPERAAWWRGRAALWRAL